MLPLALVAATLLAAQAAPIPAPAHARQADTITIGVTDLPGTLDPGEAYDFAAWEVLSHLYTGLTRQVPGTFEYELALARAVTVSEDKLSYTFTLRSDAAFSDGTPITAQTFVDSITRVQALGRDASQAVTPYIRSVAAAADGRLVFTLLRPVPYFLGLLSLPPYFPVHPSLAAATAPQPVPAHLIGNGPYVLDNFQVRQQITLAANPDYTLGPQPATPVIVLKRLAKSSELREALKNHSIDLAWRALFLGDLLDVQKVDGLKVVEVPSTRVFYAYMSHDLEPFDDPQVREAVTVLLDRQSVVNAVFQGHAAALTSLIPPEFTDAYAPIWPDVPDVARAEETLRAAAYSSRGQSRLNFAVVISQPTYGDLYVSAAAELNRASFGKTQFIESSVSWNIDTSTFLRALERGEGQHSLVLFAWTPIVPHPDAYLHFLAHSSEPIPAHGKYASQQIDAMLDEAAVLDDAAQQGKRYAQAAQLLLRNYDLAPLWQDHLQVVARDDIGGIQIESNFLLHYDQLVRQ
jgi:peptide/nickel transport system substrate-binding protein